MIDSQASNQEDDSVILISKEAFYQSQVGFDKDQHEDFDLVKLLDQIEQQMRDLIVSELDDKDQTIANLKT